jgi:hypothetical protein
MKSFSQQYGDLEGVTEQKSGTSPNISAAGQSRRGPAPGGLVARSSHIARTGERDPLVIRTENAMGVVGTARQDEAARKRHEDDIAEHFITGATAEARADSPHAPNCKAP